jgi:predicted transcriptional regulator
MAEFKIYGLTTKGLAAARQIRNPDEPQYNVLASLYKLQRADILAIADDTGLSKVEVGIALRKLQCKGFIGTE